jgi:hypothetical protein
MTTSQPVTLVVFILIAAVCLVPPALAAPSQPVGQGEAKNEPPFTAPYNGDPGLMQAYAKVARLEAQAADESKSTPGFTDSVGSPRSGFSWIYASLGALAAFGTCLLLAGVLSARRRHPVAPVSPGLLGRGVV